jgi:hypothetical protein
VSALPVLPVLLSEILLAIASKSPTPHLCLIPGNELSVLNTAVRVTCHMVVTGRDVSLGRCIMYYAPRMLRGARLRKSIGRN